MLSKSTLIKIAVGILVVAVIWAVMKLRKPRAPERNVIVTAMPVMDGGLGGFDAEDDYGMVATSAPKENYTDWAAEDAGEVEEEDEGFTEYSSPEFKSDLLDE